MKDIIRMNQLAGIITEGQAKKMLKALNENEVNNKYVVEGDGFYMIDPKKAFEYLKQFNEKTIIIGGGETASLISDKNSNIYVSTGGGALLEFLEKKITKNENLVGLDIYC